MTGDQPRVATRLLRLCLRSDGSLSRSPLLAATTRAALLADLALHGALTSTTFGLELDTTPTGFAPADQLLDAVVAQPDQNLEWWVRRGPDALRDVVADLLATGVWTRAHTGLGRRYRDNDPITVKADAVGLRAVLDGATTPDAPSTAVLVTLLGVIGTDGLPGGQQPTEADLAACGRARWLMGDLVDYLLARRRLFDAAATEARIALTANFIQ